MSVVSHVHFDHIGVAYMYSLRSFFRNGCNVGRVWRGAGLIFLLLLLARSGGCGLVLEPRHAYSLSAVVCCGLRPTAEMLSEGRFRRRQAALEATL
jgi:hypothetical protein